MIEQSVPKPSSSFVPVADDKCNVAAVVNSEPKGSGFGTPCELASKRAHEAGTGIVAVFGAVLGVRDRGKVLAAFRRTLFPPKRPGRRCKETVTAAHRDWKNGMRGPALYRAHIPGWEKHNRFRRQSEQRTLMEAIRTRVRREQERTARATQLKCKMGSGSLASGPVESEVKADN